MMNKNIAEGKWTQLKGEIQKMWGHLTDDEVNETKGDLTKLAGVIQVKYGETEEAIRSKLNSFVTQILPDNNETGSTRPTTSDKRTY